MEDKGTPVRTEDFLQIIGEQQVQIHMLQKMLRAVSHSDLQEKEKLNGITDNSVANSTGSFHSGSQGDARG